jgi:hypothetical protein
MTSRNDLIVRCQEIRNESGAGANTRERVGGLLEDLARSTAMLAPNIELWVDEDDGDDAEDGAGVDRAVATFARAWEIVGSIIPSGVKVRINVAATSNPLGYSDGSFFALPEIRGELEIVGIEREEILPAQTFTGFGDSLQLVMEFDSPDWDLGEFSGFDIECVGSPTQELVGLSRTVVYNHADSLVVGGNVYANDGSWHGPAPVGSVFRVTAPGVKINAEAVTRPDLVSDRVYRTVAGGVGSGLEPGHGALGSGGGILRLRNIEFRIPDGRSDDLYFTGVIDVQGVHVTSNHSSECRVVFSDANLRAGSFYDSNYGWGFSTRSRDPTTNPMRPRLLTYRTLSELIYAGGPAQFWRGCVVQFGRAGMYDMAGYSPDFPHAAIYARGAYVYTGFSSSEAFFCNSVSGAFDIELQNGEAEIYQPIQHIGQGALIRCRQAGISDLAAEPVTHDGLDGRPAGAGLMGTSVAHYGGQCRLIGWDGSAMGTITVGQLVPTSRDLATVPITATTGAAALVEGSENSRFFRTG